MGLFFILAFMGVAGLIVAVVSALILRRLATRLLMNKGTGAAPIIRDITLLPFICLVWAGLGFIFQGTINDVYLHRDAGLGDTSYCPLPNGYEIAMGDASSQGNIFNPKTQSLYDPVRPKRDAMPGVVALQVFGPYIFGEADSHWFEDYERGDPRVDRFFILNSRNGTRQDLSDLASLRSAAVALSGAPLELKPIVNVYRMYRFTWFDLAALLLLVLPPAGFVVMLTRKINLLASQNSPTCSPGL